MMDNLNASGSATNAGIDYQQRVAAFFLVALLFDYDISNVLDLQGHQYIKNIAFETGENIDDLRLQLTDLKNIYLQIKRSLNLSSSINSDFYKTMKQFVKQFVQNPHSNDIFILITSSDSSPKIVKDLVKIFTSVRLNDENFVSNPLSKAEYDTYEKYQQIVIDIFRSQTGKEMTHQEFINFSKKTFVTSFDIEAGKVLEKSVIMFLLDKVLISPELLWGLLIKNSLYYSAKRLSLNKEGLMETVNKYLKVPGSDRTGIEELDPSTISDLIEETGTSLPSGKGVLLIRSFVDNFDYMKVELFRFADDGSKKFKFFDNKCLVKNSSIIWTVIHRAATNTGMMRFLFENDSLFPETTRFVDIPANDIEEVESTPYARAYSELCRALLKKNRSPLTCLHCGKAVREKDNLVVEIDDEELEHTVATVHKGCLRPIDRVLAVVKSWLSEKYDFLSNFDGITWGRAIMEGQSVFELVKTFNARDTYAWDPDYRYDEEGNYCIKVNMEDGSYRYIRQRGKVMRFNEQVARDHANFFNNSFEEGRKERNPYCYTSLTNLFGKYSYLISEKGLDEEYIECISAEPVRYSNLIGKIYDTSKNYYAPLCILVNPKTKEWITINSYVVLLSDPLLLMDFITNWKKAGVEIGEYEIKIIENDREFDTKMHEFFDARLNVIVDPLIDNQMNFIKGLVVMNYEELSRKTLDGNAFHEKTLYQKDALEIPAGLTFTYEFKGQIWKVRILREINGSLPSIGQEEYYTLEGSSDALFLADKIRPNFPVILVDEELDAVSILQVAKDIIAPTATGGITTARQNLWVDLLSQASIVLISFPNNEAGYEASKWWLDHLPSAKNWPIPQEYKSINEMLVRNFDIRNWILSGLDEGK